jgi:hypothetical protein
LLSSANVVVDYGQVVEIGPWTVQSEVVKTPPTQDHPDVISLSFLAQKAVPSMDHLMEGEIEYYLTVPTSLLDVGKVVPQPLVLSSEFTKASRPAAWKSTDLKIQAVLPLLGMDEIATETKPILEQQASPDQLVKVTLSLGKKK